MIRCLLVDDEAYSLDILEAYARRCRALEIIARCSNVFEMDEVMKREGLDLIFLDIQMPQVSGIQALRSPLLKDTKVILVTAFRTMP